jgi:hypothetical protein
VISLLICAWLLCVSWTLIAIGADLVRTDRIDRWAHAAGMRRMPGESNDELLRRIGARWTVEGPWR